MAYRNSKIFISYRREDCAGHAGRLYADLINEFGIAQVFFDLDTISPGEDFAEVIQRAVGSCDAMVVVVGNRWLDVGEGTVRRLDNPRDFVRLEISAALGRNIPIIPVLIQGAAMPHSEDLPEALKAIATRQPLEISDNRWDYDVRRLTARLKQVIPNQTAYWRTIGVIVVCMTVIVFGVVRLSSMRWRVSQINKKIESVQISSPITELSVFEPDPEFLVRFGIGIGANSDNSTFYVLNFILMDKVCGRFIPRINTSINVGGNVKAQELLARGSLNEPQRSLLSGAIASKGKRLVMDAKIARLRSNAPVDYLDPLIKDDDLDTLIASILDAQ